MPAAPTRPPDTLYVPARCALEQVAVATANMVAIRLMATKWRVDAPQSIQALQAYYHNIGTWKPSP